MLTRVRALARLGVVTALLSAFFVGSFSKIALAEQDPTRLKWKNGDALRGQSKKKPDKFDGAEDISGLACAAQTGFPRICMIVDDEAQGAQIVILREDRLVAGRYVPLVGDVFDRKDGDGAKPLELDAEGVAFADGIFYVVGSHGWPRLKNKDDKNLDEKAKEAFIRARAKAARHLFGIRVDLGQVDLETGAVGQDPKIVLSADLSAVLADSPVLKGKFDKALDEQGVTIEGIAVRKGDLVVGMRSPVTEDRQAIAVRIPIASLSGGGGALPDPDRFELENDSTGKPRGIRDLAVHGQDLLILAGPQLDPTCDCVKAGDYTIYRRRGAALTKLEDLPSFGMAANGRPMKPEALLPLAETADGLRVLVLFDGPERGAPTSIDIPYPP